MKGTKYSGDVIDIKPLSFIDLFGAPGGMSLGFKLAGMRSLGALDIFSYGIETYKRNFRDTPKKNMVCLDANQSDIVKQFQHITSLKRGDVDIIIGGPPCQGFSNVGRAVISRLIRDGKRNGSSHNPKFINDKRNNLYKSFIKFVDKFRPQAVVMENVQGMLSYKNGRVVEQIQDDFRTAGYSNVSYNVLNAVEYGVPQFRKRIFFMATRNGTEISWPKKTHFSKSEIDGGFATKNAKDYVTVSDAIGDLPILSIPKKGSNTYDSIKKYRRLPSCQFQNWARGRQNLLHNNITRWHRKKDLTVFRNMGQGEKWSDLSHSDRKKIGYNDTSFSDKWRRLSNIEPSWTVLSHISKDGYMYIHPGQNRTISVREAARLQGFPDHFVFCGSRTAQFRQIGNAVPPLLAAAIAKHLKKILVH